MSHSHSYYAANDGSLHRITVIEEHVSVISEPGSNYLGHVSPSSGSAEDIKTALWDLITDRNINKSKLSAIGCDGMVVNTEKNAGVIRLLEMELGRPLQWVICQLHCNELPLRHILEHLDGATTGPRSFSGPIGKSLSNCEQLPIVQFQKIEGQLPEVNKKVLSTDQKYLLDICKAVSSGEFPQKLATRSPTPDG